MLLLEADLGIHHPSALLLAEARKTASNSTGCDLHTGGEARGVTAQLAVVGAGQEAGGMKLWEICTKAEGGPRRSWAGKPDLTALCLSAGRPWARERVESPPVQNVIEGESIRLRRHQAGPCSPWPGRKVVTTRRNYYFINSKLCLHVGQTQSQKSGIQSSFPRRITPEIWPSLELKAQLAKGFIMAFGCHRCCPGSQEGHVCLAKWV